MPSGLGGIGVAVGNIGVRSGRGDNRCPETGGSNRNRMVVWLCVAAVGVNADVVGWLFFACVWEDEIGGVGGGVS